MKTLKLLTLTLTLFLTSSSKASSEFKWQTDFEIAKQKAKEERKKIIMLFDGSDWCIYCNKMDRYIWHNKEFQNYAKDRFIMLKLDFPKAYFQAKQKDDRYQNNKTLLQQYNPEGYFPMVLVFDENGNKLGKDGYRTMSPKRYIKHLSNAQNW